MSHFPVLAPWTVAAIAAALENTPSPSVTPTIGPGAQSGDATAWIAAGAAILAALITGSFVLIQLRSNRRLEREKIELADQLERERENRAEERKEAAERAKVAQEFEERLEHQVANADARQRHAIEYRLKIANRLRNLKILDMSRTLELDRLYVQLRVREEEPLRFARDEEITEVTRGDPERLLQASRELLRARVTGSFRPEDALSRFARIIVLGDPGAGKTTMLRYLAFRAAREELGPGVALPVYVELRDFIDSGDQDLLAYAAADMQRRYGFPDAQPYLEQEFGNSHAVMLLDGLDEVLGGESAEAADAAYRKVTSEADRLATRYPGLSIAVTCRKAGWRGGLPQFQTLEVLDFDWPEIKTFIGNWFTANPVKAMGLQDALAANLRMQTLAANPLLLSLIAIVYERELELPERRAELYNRCIEVLLKDWDAHREIKRFSRFTTDRKRDLLEEVAWHFHGAGRRYFPEDELLEIIRAFLPTIEILDPEAPELILKEIVAQYGLLKEQARGWYGFLHLTLQEYFAAYAANERGPGAIAKVVSLRHDPWWEEVILLLAGRMSDASPLLLGILGRALNALEPPANEPLAADDDLFQGDLLLSGHCLASRPRLRAQWLRERIVREVYEQLLSSPYELTYRRAARILAEIGGEANRTSLLALVGSAGIPEDRREAVASALADVGDRASAPALLAALEHFAKDEPAVAGNFAASLARLQYKPALPVMIRFFRTIDTKKPDIQLFEYFRWIAAVSTFGDKSVKAEMWDVVDYSYSRKKYQLGDLIIGLVIGELGDVSDVPRLLSLLEDRADTVSGVVARLGGIQVAPRLLEVLLARNEKFGEKASIVRALSALKAPNVVEEILQAVGDFGLDWRIRWFASEVLDGYPRQECEPELVRLLDLPGLDKLVRVGVASVLANWDNAAGLPHLLGAFNDDVYGYGGDNSDSLSAAGRPYSLHAGQRVARALLRLGDRTIVPLLLDRYSKMINQRSGNHLIISDLGNALATFKAVDSIPYLIEGLEPWGSGEGILAEALTKEALPVVYNAIDSGQFPSPSGMISVFREIGDMADTPTDATRLLRSFLSLDAQQRYSRSLFDALETVSRRAKVRVYADGRVTPVDV